MCYTIEASFILIHLLKTREYCTIFELVEKKHRIEKVIPSVFIDVSRNSVLSYIECFPEIFELDDDKILKREDSEKYFKEPLIEYFDLGIELSIKCKITDLLEND